MSFARERRFDCADILEPFKCHQCINFATYKSTDLKRHLEANHSVPELAEKRYVCENCNFRTFSKFLLFIHQLKSCLQNVEKKTDSSISKTKNKNEKIKVYKCDYCPYATKRTNDLKKHILCKHTDPETIQWFECQHCLHRCKTKATLKNHIADMHGDRELIKCDQCSYTTKRKGNLKNHIAAKHTDPEDIQWFECPHCTYRSRFKSCLIPHIKHQHENPSTSNVERKSDKNKVSKCEHCSYATTRPDNLRRHVFWQHTNPKEIQWFECEHCRYKSKSRQHLVRHVMSKHKEMSALDSEEKIEF